MSHWFSLFPHQSANDGWLRIRRIAVRRLGVSGCAGGVVVGVHRAGVREVLPHQQPELVASVVEVVDS